MENSSTKTKTFNSFKIIIIVLTLVILGCVYFMYTITDRTKNIVDTLRDEKHLIENDLEKSQLLLSQIRTTNGNLSEKLAEEQQKVIQLLKEIEDGKVNDKNIVVYKKNVSEIDEKIKNLLLEIEKYKKEIDSTKIVLNSERKKNDTLNTSNKKLSKQVNVGSKLYYYSLNTKLYKQKTSGVKTETTKANKVNVINLSFMIAENDLAKAFQKDFYIQIIDSKNNVIGQKKEISFGQSVLNYSQAVTVKYDKKTTKIELELSVNELEKGNYFVNIFDKSSLVLDTSFVLD